MTTAPTGPALACAAAALAALFALGLAAPAAAETMPAPAEPPGLPTDAARDIPEAEWRTLTAGRTVWYRIGEDLWGRERYWPGRDRVTFQFPDGECVEADWYREDGWYCFDFHGAPGTGEAPHCFRHVRSGDDIWALGAGGGPPQLVDRIDTAPLTCGSSPSV